MAEAHEGLVHDPSAVGRCDACHADAAAAAEHSLHSNLWGEIAAVEARSHITLAGSPYEGHFDNKCGSCHTTCGQCHISRPNSVGGGFPKIGSYYSHRFRKTPDMNEQCTACHGSRVGVDFKGELAGNQPDIHRTKGYRCEFCHTMQEIHGDGQQSGDHYNDRYEVKSMPRCEQCHAIADNVYHQAHVNQSEHNLQCQVCHSQPYKTCTNCHNLGAAEFAIEPSQIQFKIAKNPNPHRAEYDIAVVRHVPIGTETYADWGLTVPGYLTMPTWSYASPHNILRWTPQTTVEAGKACSESCHKTEDGPTGYLLRESDLFESDGVTRLPDYDANIDLVIDEDF